MSSAVKVEPGLSQEDERPKRRRATLPIHSRINEIKNKTLRAAAFRKLKVQKSKEKKELKELRKKRENLLGEKRIRPIPHTIDSLREPDATLLTPEDEDLALEQAMDKFSQYYNKQYQPQVLITATQAIYKRTFAFARELARTIPNSSRVFEKTKKKHPPKKLVEAAQAKGFTDVLIVNEDNKRPNGILLVHLPDGPSAMFRLSSIKLCKDIKRRPTDITLHRPEVILNNFKTRLGYNVGRMLGALYDYEPEFKGRRVCTFHNQRDYVFFRHHFYEFKSGSKVVMRELGPRFTLRLLYLQEGACEGDFEWSLKRHEMETSRRRFFL